MTKLAEIQKAIVALPATERDELREWLLTQGGVLDPETDTAELERELLKAVHGPHKPYSYAELQAACERRLRKRRSA